MEVSERKQPLHYYKMQMHSFVVLHIKSGVKVLVSE